MNERDTTALDATALDAAIVAGDRRALARAITLIESTRADHRADAIALLDRLAARTGGSLRVGISGTPGVGKSTLIEALGLHLTQQQLRIAVLTVDPSSSRTGGSILGDKTRMGELARQANAFIRPSPSSGTLGGVARRTREALLLCEAAGFDVVLVETVGVGQSETAVAQMTDVFVLLVAPGGGDELQGVKRGIMELADLLVVNKCDGPLEPVATATAADYASALRLVRPRTRAWTPTVQLASAVTGRGIPETWELLTRYRAALRQAGEWEPQRVEQRRSWLWDEVRDRVIDAIRRDPTMTELEAEVVTGRRSPASAADAVVARHLQPRHLQPRQPQPRDAP